MLTASQLKTAANNTAWKTTTMRGYLFKTVLDADTYGTSAYTLTFREAENSDSNPVDYVFYFDLDMTKAASQSAVQGEVDLDFELLGHILTANWQTGTKDDFELARVGNGGVW